MNHVLSRPARRLSGAAHARAAAVFSSVLLSISGVQAATDTWIGNVSANWNTAANWTSGVPTNGSTLLFNAPGNAGVALVDDLTPTTSTLTVGGANADGIDFGLSAGIYSITRSGTQTITLGSSGTGIGVSQQSAGLVTLAVPLVYSANQTIQVGATTGAQLASLTLSGAQTGGFRLTKTGTGLLSLNGTNALGGLTVNAGTVNIATDAQLSSTAPAAATAGFIILDGGTLRANVNTAFTLNANRGIALGDGTAGSGGTISVIVSNGGAANTSTLIYNGVIANNGGTNSLTKTGTQILALGGASTYTGATRINQGQITLDFTATGAPTSNIIASGSNLVMGDVPTALLNTVAGSPILLVQGSNTATTSQTFSGTTINPGNASILARGGTSTFNTTVALGALTHTAGGTVGFSLLTNGSTGQGVITTSTANTNGILGGWATTTAVGTGTVPLAQTDWAANDGNGNIVAYTGYTIPTGATPTLANNAANNVRIDATSTGNVSPTFTANVSDLNTIQGTDTAARVITVGAGNTLRLGNFGGIWKTTAGTLTIGAATASGGTLTAGGAANTAGEIVFNAAGAGIIVNSVIANNGSGVVNIVKTGASSLTLNAANTYTGGLIVNQGSISTNAAGAFGGAGRDVTVLPGAQINLTANTLTYANNFNIAGSALLLAGNTASGTITMLADATIGASANGGIITGRITGDFNLSILGTGNVISSTSNDFTGNFGINGLSGALGANVVSVALGNSEVIPNGVGKGNLIFSGSSTVGNNQTLDLNGKTETVNGLVSAESINTVIAAANANQERITNNAAGTASRLTLGDSDRTATFMGIIQDGTGTVAITKIGAGTQTFSGANTYSGGTIVSGGTLLLGAANTLQGATGTVTVSGGRLTSNFAGTAGTANLGGGLTMTSGSIDPNGPSVGMLTLASAASFTMSGGTLNLNLGTAFDSIAGSGGGAFTITGGTFALDTTGAGFSYTGQYNVLSGFTGTNSVSGLSFTGYDTTNYTASLSTAGTLSFVAVPEPSSWALFAGGLCAVAAVRRLRRRVAVN